MSYGEPKRPVIEVEALWQRLAELEDGSLDPAGRDELTALLDESRAARRLYSEYFAHSVALAKEGRFLNQLRSLPVLADGLQARRTFLRSALAAAALLALGAIVASLVMVKPPAPETLTAAATAGAKWTVDGVVRDAAADEWSVVAGSTVQVSSGTLELRLESGAAMVMQGPAQASFPELTKPVLSQGWLWLDSGSADAPFVVETPDLLVRDIGTRFGLYVPEQDPAELHLIEGQVEVVAKRTGKTIATCEPLGRGMLIPAFGQPATVALARDPFPELAGLLAAAQNYPSTIRSQNPAGYWRIEDPEVDTLANEMADGLLGGRHPQVRIDEKGPAAAVGFPGFGESNRAALLPGASEQVPLSLGATPAPQGVLFHDDFNGDGTDLNGAMPDRTMGKTRWVAFPAFNRDGSIDRAAGSATLAFTPANGVVYTLDASFAGISGNDDWIAAGFAKGQATSGSDTMPNKNRFVQGQTLGLAWMLARGSNLSLPNRAQTVGAADAVDWEHPLLAHANGGNLDMRIVLDTTGGGGQWTATWFAKRPADDHFTQVRGRTPLINESISSVGFAVAGGDVTGTITNFSLRADPAQSETAAMHLADKPACVARSEGAMSFWIRREGKSGQREMIWSAGEDPYDDSIHSVLTAEGYIALFVENGRYDVLIASEESIVDGRWHHLAMSWSPSAVDLYLDGRKVASDTEYRGRQQGILTDLRFGCGPRASKTASFAGWVDEIALWDRALTPVEVQHQFRSAQGK